MAYETTKKIFELLILLNGTRTYTIEEIYDRLEIDERTFFRYKDALHLMGFPMECNDGRYKLTKEGALFSLVEHRKKSIRSFKEELFTPQFDLLKFYNILTEANVNSVPEEFIEDFSHELKKFYSTIS